MSEFGWLTGWPGISRSDAPETLKILEASLRHDGMITGPAHGTYTVADAGQLFGPGPGSGMDKGETPGLPPLHGVDLAGPGYIDVEALDAERLICPQCASSTREGAEGAAEIREAAQATATHVLEGGDGAALHCPVCGTNQSLNDWLMPGMFLASHVVVTAWNWEREPFKKLQESLIRALPGVPRAIAMTRL